MTLLIKDLWSFLHPSNSLLRLPQLIQYTLHITLHLLSVTQLADQLRLDLTKVLNPVLASTNLLDNLLAPIRHFGFLCALLQFLSLHNFVLALDLLLDDFVLEFFHFENSLLLLKEVLSVVIDTLVLSIDMVLSMSPLLLLELSPHRPVLRSEVAFPDHLNFSLLI